MRQPRFSTTAFLAALAATWILAAGLATGQAPFAPAFQKALEGPRAADPNFSGTAATIASRLIAQKPATLDEVGRQANFVASGIQPSQAVSAWIEAFNSLLKEVREQRVAPPPANVAEEVARLLNQARAGEFVVAAPDQGVQALADSLLASEVFRRDVRFTDTAKALIAELSRVLPLVGTKYKPADPGQAFADEVIQHLEQTVIAKVEGERMKNEWRATYNAYIKSVKEQPSFAGTADDWRLAIDRAIRALQNVVAIAGTLPQNPFAAGAAPAAGGVAAAGTGSATGGGWYSHAAVRHERKMSRIIGRNEIRSLRVQRYRGY
jgi:hypothetical protein